MPLVDIRVIEGVFTPVQKKDMIARVTDTLVRFEGAALHGVTRVRVREVKSGDLGIGGQALGAADGMAMQSSGG